VEEILVEADRAVGVKLTDGSEHRGDRVICTAPGHATLFRLLGGRYLDAELGRRYARWPTSSPAALVSFGVTRRWPELPALLHARLAGSWRVVGHPVERLQIRNFSDDSLMAPPGHTVVQAMFETPFDLWHDTHHDPDRYHRLIALLAHQALERLEPFLPGLGQTELQMRDVVTPYTFWRFARSWRGAFAGWLPTPEARSRQLPKTLPGLAGFYMAGQWTEPGGGVPAVIRSGRHAVQLLCHDDRVPFHGTESAIDASGRPQLHPGNDRA
jgi:phytoene dehydrogenase-like protein